MRQHGGQGGGWGPRLSGVILRVPLLALVLPSGEAASPAGAYYWPSQKGSATRTGFSRHPVPDISKSPTWSWLDPHGDVIRATPLIDDKMNVYLSTIPGRIYKFDADGNMLWMRQLLFGTQVVGSIYDGKLIIATKHGKVIALSMETGEDVWSTPVSPVGATALDTASVLAFDGLVLSATHTDHNLFGGNAMVVAVNATDGAVVWWYLPDIPVYNFQASAPEDGTLVFQDRSGGLYRLRLSDGSEVWKSGKKGFPFDRSFTTGATVCHEGLVYVVSNTFEQLGQQVVTRGLLHVYKLEDGSPAWEQVLPYPANQAVTVGPHPTEKGRLVAALGIGQNPAEPGLLSWERYTQRWFPKVLAPMTAHLVDLYLGPYLVETPAAMAAYDAKTGERLWHYELPPYRKLATAGDSERVRKRLTDIATNNTYNDPLCLPDSCSQPVMGPDGTVYQGWQDGRVYAVRDANGDGRIDESEVKFHQLSDGFQGSMGLAPGLFAAAPCGGGLYVWRS